MAVSAGAVLASAAPVWPSAGRVAHPGAHMRRAACDACTWPLAMHGGTAPHAMHGGTAPRALHGDMCSMVVWAAWYCDLDGGMRCIHRMHDIAPTP
eukprot:350592-Chlamydomonas_euryale.AAC.1